MKEKLFQGRETIIKLIYKLHYCSRCVNLNGGQIAVLLHFSLAVFRRSEIAAHYSNKLPFIWLLSTIPTPWMWLSSSSGIPSKKCSLPSWIGSIELHTTRAPPLFLRPWSCMTAPIFPADTTSWPCCESNLRFFLLGCGFWHRWYCVCLVLRWSLGITNMPLISSNAWRCGWRLRRKSASRSSSPVSSSKKSSCTKFERNFLPATTDKQ